MSRSRNLFIGVALMMLLAGLGWGWRSMARSRQARERALWKAGALERLAGLSLTNAEVVGELDFLRTHRVSKGFPEWTGDQVLVMTNGEYLVYSFRHGSNDGFVDHLFLAHGSDGRWYFSTYHFCNHMAAVMADEPPGSIAQFAATYAAREFDGRSDICLQRTWPGPPQGHSNGAAP